MALLWFLISEETRQKLLKRMKKLAPYWLPPRDDSPDKTFKFKLEDTEEIGKIMTRKPHKPRGADAGY